jgi:hypothetical protein
MKGGKKRSACAQSITNTEATGQKDGGEVNYDLFSPLANANKLNEGNETPSRAISALFS